MGLRVLESAHTGVYCVCMFICLFHFKYLQWYKAYNCILATGECGIFIVLYVWHRLSRNETHTYTQLPSCLNEDMP